MDIQRAGWTIRCIFGADEEGSHLEYYATHRMTSDSRYRIYASGRTHERDAIWEMFMWDPKKPGDQARAHKEYADHNARIAEELKLLGLYPEATSTPTCERRGLPRTRRRARPAAALTRPPDRTLEAQNSAKVESTLRSDVGRVLSPLGGQEQGRSQPDDRDDREHDHRRTVGPVREAGDEDGAGHRRAER
jgi:hypothetical protein